MGAEHAPLRGEKRSEVGAEQSLHAIAGAVDLAEQTVELIGADLHGEGADRRGHLRRPIMDAGEDRLLRLAQAEAARRAPR